jgi:hypothetical protein
MRKPLFSLLRGADGRSLARALIALFVLSIVIGGFGAGAMASGRMSDLTCAATPADGAGNSGPADADGWCCGAGCAPALLASVEPASTGVVLGRPGVDLPRPVAIFLSTQLHLLQTGAPRGPPASA